MIPPEALTVLTQALYGSNKSRVVAERGLVQLQTPPITIGDPVGAAAAEPVDFWGAEPVDCWLVDGLPAVVGLLDDVLLLDEQATSTTAAASTQRTRFNGRKPFIFPPEHWVYSPRRSG